MLWAESLAQQLLRDCSVSITLSLHTQKNLPLYINLRMRRTPGRGKTRSKFYTDFFSLFSCLRSLCVPVGLCKQFYRDKVLNPKAQFSQTPATLDYFQYPRAKAGREQLLSAHKAEVLSAPGQGGTQCLVRSWAGGEESPTLAPAWGHQCPMAPCTEKWRKIGFLKKAWSKSQPKPLWKPH